MTAGPSGAQRRQAVPESGTLQNMHCVWQLVLTQRGVAAGRLAHDFLHHQVFRSRGWNNFVGLLLGNVSQVSLQALAGAAHCLDELPPGCL